MTKKLTEHGDSLALIIDKPVLDILGIHDKTDLDVQKKKEESISKIGHEIMDKYESVFKKLAKT